MHIFIFIKRSTLLTLLLFCIPYLVVTAQIDSNSIKYNWYNDYDVKFYNIDLNASDTSRYIEGNSSVLSILTANKLDTFMIELGHHLMIDSVIFNSIRVNYDHIKDLVYVFSPSTIFKGQSMMVTIFYKGTVPSYGFFSGLSNRKDYLLADTCYMVAFRII